MMSLLTELNIVLRKNFLWSQPVGAGSIPNVFLVPFDLVLSQQRAQLVLEANFAMMLFLPGDVLLYRFEIRLAHGEIRVAALPLEAGVIATAFLQPEIGDAFQFLHPFGLREGASESREQMHVVFHAADEDGRAIELFGDAAEVRVERVARGFVAQERPAVLGGENQMNVNGGKGLWHNAIQDAPTGHWPPAQRCPENLRGYVG